jgi:hypothetical protein
VPSWSEFGLAFQRTKPKPPSITSNEDGLRIISNNNSKIRNSLSLLRKSYGLFGQRELGHGKVDAAVAHWKLQKSNRAQVLRCRQLQNHPLRIEARANQPQHI